jgi:phage terminase small subunit
MNMEDLIPVNEFCANYNIEISFISSLRENGLIEIITIEEIEFIPAGSLRQLEKIVSFYYELGINIEGIETITNLLQRINDQQEEITALRNRLRLYEDI